MLQKAANKLVRLEGHTSLRGTAFVVFVAEGDFAVFKSFDAMVRNCHPVDVVAQVMDNTHGPGKWFLTIHHPFFPITKRF